MLYFIFFSKLKITQDSHRCTITTQFPIRGFVYVSGRDKFDNRYKRFQMVSREKGFTFEQPCHCHFYVTRFIFIHEMFGIKIPVESSPTECLKRAALFALATPNGSVYFSRRTLNIRQSELCDVTENYARRSRAYSAFSVLSRELVAIQTRTMQELRDTST